MPKNLDIKTETLRQRKLTGIFIQISPHTRDVTGRFDFTEVSEFSDGSKESKPSLMAFATEQDLTPFLSDQMWDAVSSLAHGLADAQTAKS